MGKFVWVRECPTMSTIDCYHIYKFGVGWASVRLTFGIFVCFVSLQKHALLDKNRPLFQAIAAPENMRFRAPRLSAVKMTLGVRNRGV